MAIIPVRCSSFRATAWMWRLVMLVPLLAACSSAVGTGTVAPAASVLPAVTPEAVSDAETATPDAAREDDLAALSDEFDDAHTLGNWQDHAAVEGWPNWIETADVNTTSAGHLYLVPRSSGWYQDYRGVFLFKEVTGDFDVTTRIQATGKDTPIPQRPFSLSGLMVRAPRQVTMETWEPGHENWLFITTGYGDNAPERKGKPQIETKTTKNSKSTLILRLSQTGWVDLRIVRVGTTFLMLYRWEGQSWAISQRYERPDLPQTLQVGLNAYSSWSGSEDDALAFNRTADPVLGDLVVRSDYVRFRRPQLRDAVTAQQETDDITNSEWLEFIGE